MSVSLESLPGDKRSKILEACLDEFSEKGYERASTNRIVKAAGISKGLLFHYFGSKKELFIYVLDRSIDRMMELMEKYRSYSRGDIFDLLAEDAAVKLRVGVEEPRMYRILYDVYVNLPEEIKKELMERYARLFEAKRGQLFGCMDESLLREGVSAKMAVDIIADFLAGYYQRRLAYFKTLSPEELLKDMEHIRDDIMGHLKIIRRGIYRDA